MLYDKIENISRYLGISKNLDTAIRYIQDNDLSKLEFGTHKIDDDNVLVFVQDNTLIIEDSPQFEYHKNFMDIQLIDEGYEKISYGQGDSREVIPYDLEKEIGFNNCSESVSYFLDTTNFVAFFPGEYHQPNHFAGRDYKVRKYVFKVRFH